MTSPTHITFSAFVYLLILTTTGIALSAVNAIAMTVASVLPDVDTGASFIGKSLPFISRPLERRFGHRTLTHSLLSVLALSLLLALFCLLLAPFSLRPTQQVCICFLAGYLSHPLLDSCTINGVKLFYPFSSVRCVFPHDVNMPARYRIRTGSSLDHALGIIFLAGCIPTYLIAHQGYERFIRATQKSVEAAVRDYNEFSRDHRVQAEIEGYDMLTKLPLSGIFEIVGALNPHTLLFRGADGRLHTLGKEFESDYVAKDVVCQPWIPSHASVRMIDMSNQLLAQLRVVVDTSAENYLFGDIATMDKVSLPENLRIFTPVTGSGNTIRFNFAQLNDILDLNLDGVFVAKGILTIKTIGDPPHAQMSTDTARFLPRPGDFTQLAFTIQPGETLSVMKQKGDTVREGDLLARKILPDIVEEQIVLNAKRMEESRRQFGADLLKLESRLRTLAQDARRDSGDYHECLRMAERGFISRQALESSELKWKNAKNSWNQVQARCSMLFEKSRFEVSRLKLVEMQLRARAEVLRRQSELRSTVGGLIVDIRQVAIDTKTRLVFIIKRLAN